MAFRGCGGEQLKDMGKVLFSPGRMERGARSQGNLADSRDMNLGDESRAEYKCTHKVPY